ncbi:hypothetical protein TNCV_2881371 [Trichonephila clavipes]|nr:hypothetical protein TNCV_2881371 [Trichonephila clavipes]
MLATALSSSDTCHVKAHVVRSPPRTGAHGLGGRPFPLQVSAPFVPTRPPRKMRSLISVQVSEPPSLSANRFPNMRALVPKNYLVSLMNWMECLGLSASNLLSGNFEMPLTSSTIAQF